MIDSRLKDLMITSASFQNVSSRDVYGARTGGSTVTFKCHIKYDRKEAYNSDGAIVTFGGTVYMDGVYNVQKGAILNLPDGTKPKILDVQTFYDEIGSHHTTINFEG